MDEIAPTPEPVASAAGGCLVLVVGPSGAGKDSLIDRARARLHGRNEILFPSRLVTRSAHAAEDNVAVSEEAFRSRREAGAFALHWEAHGLAYGVPAIIDQTLAVGRTVVVNVSRTVLPEARRRYARTLVVLVDAPPEVRAERLARRGREDGAAIRGRLAREVPDAGLCPDLTILNDGTLDEGAARLAAAIEGVAHPPPSSSAGADAESRGSQAEEASEARRDEVLGSAR